MKRAAALGLVAVVFAVGLAAGVLGARLLDAPDRGVSHRGPLPLHRYFRHNDLDLTDEQRRQLDDILARQREKFDAVHEDVRPRVEALMDETQFAIEAILTPEQVERYRERRDRWHRRARPRGPLRDERRRDDPRHREHDRRHPPDAPRAEPDSPSGAG